jgi:Kef-type K+ transport system membrane component KefB/CBS-domain-containing membrane protein
MVVLAAWTESSMVGLMAALFLFAAVVGGRLARLAHVPRVVGYLVAGLVARLLLERALGGPQEMRLHLGAAIDVLGVVKSLVLCLILFAIGCSFDAGHLRHLRGHLWKLTLAEVAVVGLLVYAATWLAGGRNSQAVPLLLAIGAMATAPAATVMVIRQYGAKGPMTDHVVAMVGMNNLVALVLFHAVFLLLAALGPGAGGIAAIGMERHIVAAIIIKTLGSAVVGFLIGLLLSLGRAAVTSFESLLLLLVLLFAVAQGAGLLKLDPLIVSMFVGVAFANFSIQPYRLIEELDPVAAPLLALFFVLAGFALELGRLREVGAVGVAFLLARAVGKYGGTALGVRWVGARHQLNRDLGMALLCQAGVAIGLAKHVLDHWGHVGEGGFHPDPGAASVHAVLLSSVAVFELAGPVALKWSLVRAGEVKAVTLLDRPSASLSEVGTVLGRVRQAVAAVLRRSADRAPSPVVLTARHVMRTNVESLRDTAKMQEVLRFVERSRLNHFFVVNAEGGFVGTINFRDLRNLMFNPMLAQLLTAYDMANTDPPMVLADQPLQEILHLIHRHDLGSLPVVDGLETRRLLGIVEQRDVLHAMHLTEDEEEPSH